MKLFWKPICAIAAAAAMIVSLSVVGLAENAGMKASFFEQPQSEQNTVGGWIPPKLNLAAEWDEESGQVIASVSAVGIQDLSVLEFTLFYPDGLIPVDPPSELTGLSASSINVIDGQIRCVRASLEPENLAEGCLLTVAFRMEAPSSGEAFSEESTRDITLSIGNFVFADGDCSNEGYENSGVSTCTVTVAPQAALTAVYGDTLSKVALPNGWEWLDDRQPVGSVGIHEFAAVNGEKKGLFAIRVEPLPISIIGAEVILNRSENEQAADSVLGDETAHANPGENWALTEVLFDLPEGEQITLDVDYEVRDVAFREEQGYLLISGTVTLLETDAARNFVLTDDHLAYGIKLEETAQSGNGMTKEPAGDGGSSALEEKTDASSEEPYKPEDSELQEKQEPKPEDLSDSAFASPAEEEDEAEEVS